VGYAYTTGTATEDIYVHLSTIALPRCQQHDTGSIPWVSAPAATPAHNAYA